MSFIFAGLLAGVSASNVLDLDPNNFDSAIGSGKPGLVELCVRPWYFLCQNLTELLFIALLLGGAWCVMIMFADDNLPV